MVASPRLARPLDERAMPPLAGAGAVGVPAVPGEPTTAGAVGFAIGAVGLAPGAVGVRAGAVGVTIGAVGVSTAAVGTA